MTGRLHRERPKRPLSPTLATARLLPSGSVPLTVAVGVLVMFTALLPAGFAVASGALVGSIGRASERGWDSPPGRQLIAAIATVVGLFVLQQVAGPVLRSVADALGRRVEGRLRARVMGATLAPVGVAHLEDPDVVDRVSAAQSVGTGETTVKDATIGMAAVTANSLAGAVSAVVLAAYRWWLAAALLGVYAAVTWVLARQLGQTVGALRGHTRRFRRTSYFRDLIRAVRACDSRSGHSVGTGV